MYEFTYTLRDTRDDEIFEVTCTKAYLADLLARCSFFELAEDF